ncbi:MAG: hypothetical protein DWQ31_04125 [Planctomycetota bacterium]|nr:MAG: hypothetical protein DWQ31_04125 [Planctomycetota bacterium]
MTDFVDANPQLPVRKVKLTETIGGCEKAIIYMDGPGSVVTPGVRLRPVDNSAGFGQTIDATYAVDGNPVQAGKNASFYREVTLDMRADSEGEMRMSINGSRVY